MNRRERLVESAMTPEQREAVDAARARFRTPEARARHAAIRERFEHRPGPDALYEMGEISAESRDRMKAELEAGPPDGPLRRLVAALRAERERQGLSLAAVAERAGMDRAAVHKIEIMANRNPTVDTLERYAAALGKTVELALADATRATGHG